jgi:hypothetical protein
VHREHTKVDRPRILDAVQDKREKPGRLNRIPRVATSPITLPCPRCHAEPGDVCEVLGKRLKIVHLERIQAALAKDAK